MVTSPTFTRVGVSSVAAAERSNLRPGVITLPIKVIAPFLPGLSGMKLEM